MSARCCCTEERKRSSADSSSSSARCSAASVLGRVLLVASVTALCACLAVLEVHRSRQTAELCRQVVQLQQRVARLETDPETPSRRRRAVAAPPLRTIDGVPIVDGRDPGGRRARPPSQGLRIYETFSAHGAEQPTDASVSIEEQPTAPPANYVTDDPSILPHHRSSAVYRPPSRFGRVNTNTVIAEETGYLPGAEAGAAALLRAPPPPPLGELHRKSRVSQGGPAASATRGRQSAAALLRSAAPPHSQVTGARSQATGARSWVPGARSRVPGARPRVTGARSKVAAGHRTQVIGRGTKSAPVLEARGAPPEVARPPSGPLTPAERPVSSRREHCSAAHFQAEVSSSSRKSSTYGGSEGNGRLRNTNPDAVFTEWRAADWMEVRRCGADFQLYGGQVTVRQPGLYLLYAQINYLEDSDINGFEIQVNARSLVKCITMEASDQREKTNTCYTAAVTFLNSGDAVSVRDLEPMRHAILLPDRSFFGLVRVSG